MIFAFGSNNETPANRLVYIAEVSLRVPGGRYFKEEEYKKRPDCIYERLPDRRLQRRPDAKFHAYEEAHVSDLGAEPSYPKANTILAEDFRYFGKCGTDKWKNGRPTT